MRRRFTRSRRRSFSRGRVRMSRRRRSLRLTNGRRQRIGYRL